MLISCRTFACTAAAALAVAGGVLAGSAHAAPAAGPTTASVQQFTNHLPTQPRQPQLPTLGGAATPGDWHW
ncbi:MULTISPECIES: hypothetical protein [Kitasatospora]|uniref:Uncharacterized protein n=1 Tax=Kitasatospora cathayae TaxID=3004092 RepID=A0ABY7Q5S6_9ACTN|nr:hypothetical protein [Kitasatospora sp. HUAS 3-15]WBP87606.1 hypothetical protein O1G21_18340 [Kitasatospora sp. HUAS 3-15]